MISFFLYHQPTRMYVMQHSYMYILGFISLFVVMIVLACCGEIRRRAPINFILLGLFTLIEGFMMGCITVAYSASEVRTIFFLPAKL